MPAPTNVVAVAGDGTIWASSAAKNGSDGSLYRLTPDGTISTFPVAAAISGIAIAPDDSAWFSADGKVGQVTTGGKISKYSINFAGPTNGIALGSDGNMWVLGASAIARVLTGITPDMEVSRNEVFGPVVGIAGFTDLDDALALANDSRYGLQAAIFTAELDGALRAAYELDFGGVLINEVPTFRSDQMPYGGVGDSGNTKEGPHYAVREMTQERLVVIQR